MKFNFDALLPRRRWPRYMYGSWPELELIEMGRRVAYAYDEPSTLEHRLANANGLTYGSPPRHWNWK